MIDRHAQEILAADHLEAQRGINRLGAEVRLLREIADAARRHECGAAYQDSVWARIVAYDDTLAAWKAADEAVAHAES